jgi:hypothetical protein
MRDASQPLSMRFDAAKAAAPYMHARLAAVEVKNEEPVNEAPQSALEVAKKIAFILRCAQEEAERSGVKGFSNLLGTNELGG